MTNNVSPAFYSGKTFQPATLNKASKTNDDGNNNVTFLKRIDTVNGALKTTKLKAIADLRSGDGTAKINWSDVNTENAQEVRKTISVIRGLDEKNPTTITLTQGGKSLSLKLPSGEEVDTAVNNSGMSNEQKDLAKRILKSLTLKFCVPTGDKGFGFQWIQPNDGKPAKTASGDDKDGEGQITADMAELINELIGKANKNEKGENLYNKITEDLKKESISKDDFQRVSNENKRLLKSYPINLNNNVDVNIFIPTGYWKVGGIESAVNEAEVKLAAFVEPAEPAEPEAAKGAKGAKGAKDAKAKDAQVNDAGAKDALENNKKAKLAESANEAAEKAKEWNLNQN